MTDNYEYNYTAYIDTSIDKLWEAIVTPKITRRYWLHENLSDCKIDSNCAR